MNAILNEFQSNFNSNIDLIKNEHTKLTHQIKELEEKNNLLEQENTKLTNTINELNKEKKAKASSTIWESMNSKFAEKDVIIEQLKKDIEFYKRTGPKSNIAEKWKSNISKSNSSDSIEEKEVEKTLVSNKSVEKEIELTDEEPNVVEEADVKQKEKIVVEDENVDGVDGVDDVDDEEEQEDEPVVKKSKKHKSKDKSKDKSEKKKKKKKKVVEEENE